MKNENASERVAALVHEALDVLQRAEHAPDSPVNTFVTGEMRRKLRRAARRLRMRQAEPRYKNLHNAEELADIYERTVQRDEILEKGMKDFQRITLDLRRILNENGPEVARTVGTLATELEQSAEKHGPRSEAAQRYRLLRFLGWFGQQAHEHRRKPRAPFPWKVPVARDPSIEKRLQLTAVQVLDSPPSSGEPVIDIPPEGRDSRREGLLLRIGLGEASWVGNFEIGHMSVTTVSMMPGDKHLFVSANGAGYIIDLETRTLVEEIGTDVAGVTFDASRTLFVVDHNGMSLEAFGKNGRLWKTDTISSGGFREMAMSDDAIFGEARQASPAGWAGFSVKIATGEVRFDDGL